MSKVVNIEGLGAVKLFKRRGAKALRLSVDHSGQVRLTLPVWTPYQVGMRFIMANQAWLKSRLATGRPKLSHGMLVGKAHRLAFAACDIAKVRTNIVGNLVKIDYPAHLNEQADFVQLAAKNAATRALRQEAKQLLPQRLRALSKQTGLNYKSLSFRLLKSRWGSYSQDGHITLNVFLMQLPWHLIDYVIIHELAHSQVMHHGARFWQEMERYIANPKSLRKEIRTYQPSFNSAQAVA